ncbi:TonB-dependent receptor [Rhodanobacter glycinis]|uniref:TonB-dependent receptor n=1 Tax=Rhodanobacter glycinis TaxID=582702 RepID=A0A5B9DVD6_9GAMM|nr:TonB-dependent receptor [Rhodanobacter glycinis]QEE23783.1 TonB-dependent receptor [Rhodanobacter glycinis]
MKYRYSALCGAILAVLATGNVLAGEPATTAQQDPAAPATQAGQKTIKNLGAIEVTATKRTTPLEKTPIAISAIGADTLDKSRVMTVQDITQMVPGLAATTEGDHGVITLTLRGIGNDSAKTEYADPEVATFVDGVYAPRAEAAASLLLDIDHVDVMRGPQGTLWGRNSTVGAINFVTTKPDLTGGFYGNAEMSAGNYNQIGTRAAVNLPISSTFALRVAVAQQQHDGYENYQNPVGQIPSVAQQQANYIASGGSAATFQPINTNLYITRGQKYGAQNQSAARVSALWQPNADFTWNLSYEYFRDRGTPSMNLMQNPRPGQEFWSALIDTAPYLDRTSSTVRSHIDWNLSDYLTLSYVAGYSKYSGKSDYDQDAGAVLPTSFSSGGIFQEDRTNSSNYRNSSQEIDLKSRGEHTIDWILGVYYAQENNNIRFDIPQMHGTELGSVNWQGSFIQPKETVKSDAVFGQATWHITDSLRFTAGARYSKDKKTNQGGVNWGWAYDPSVPQLPISTGDVPAPPAWAISQHNDGKYNKGHATWLGRLDLDVGQHGLLYASVSTGYKSGGLQDGGTPYAAETLTNYEVGSKFSFLDGHVTWNSAIYYERFKNFQLSAPITYPDGNQGLGFSNVKGTTKVFGIESELAARIGDNDRFDLVFSAIPKKKLGTLLYAGSNDYAGLPACAPASGISNCINITGNTLAHAPSVDVTAVYEHDFHLGNGGTLTPRLSVHHESMSWLSPLNLGEGDKQKAYTRGDFTLRYEEPQDKWWVGLYVQNIANDKVRTNAARFIGNDGKFVYVSQYLAPRTYGVNLGIWF